MSGILESFLNVVSHLGSTIPESILFGSIILYVVTLNISFGVFALFITEIILSHKFISWMITGTVGPVDKLNEKCASGFKTVRADASRIIPTHQYPAYGFFSVTAIATYLGLSTRRFSDTLRYMGPQWEGREMMAYIFIGALVALFLLIRLILCEGFSELLIGFVLAIICGGIFFTINTTFFGDEGVNFLGLPVMVSKDKTGAPIYVCSNQ